MEQDEMKDAQVEARLEYLKALKRVSESVDGKKVLNELKLAFVDQPAAMAGLDTNQIMYRLGQKELVQDILLDSLADLDQLTQTIEENIYE